MRPRVTLFVRCLAGLLLLSAGPSRIWAQGTVAVNAESRPVATDAYGGIAVRVAEPPGAFQVRRVAGRWVFITPEGHPFWMRAVYATDTPALVIEKYGSKYTWAEQATRRIRDWGFNALGEYSTPYVYPIPAYGGRTSNPEKLPFIRMIRPSQFALTNRWAWATGPVKDLIAGTDQKVYTGWRGSTLLDIFDPNFEATAIGNATDQKNAAWAPIFPQGLRTERWLIGTSTDDADHLYGFKRSTDAHMAWIVAVTAPTQESNAWLKISYQDRTVYSKRAWRTFLVGKYSTIGALNTAWGSRYTTFDSDGGWPNGHGLMDESGRSTWMGRDFVRLADTAPGVARDLEAFIEVFAERYFSTVARAIRLATPNHLVFGPAPLHDGRIPVLRAASRHLDVLQIFISQGRLADLEAIIDRAHTHFRKPLFLWTTFQAQADSPLAGHAGWKDYDFPTQRERGLAYANYLKRLERFRTKDGVNPVVGIDWWAWADKTSGGENTNFGLVSLRDNAYDGKEAVRSVGRNAAGYAIGGELRDYGDFLSIARRANYGVDVTLRQDIEAWTRSRQSTSRDPRP